jgi:hypothetical protein
MTETIDKRLERLEHVLSPFFETMSDEDIERQHLLDRVQGSEITISEIKRKLE